MLSEDDLHDAFRVFKRQTEADFFINKDAQEFPPRAIRPVALPVHVSGGNHI